MTPPIEYLNAERDPFPEEYARENHRGFSTSVDLGHFILTAYRDEAGRAWLRIWRNSDFVSLIPLEDALPPLLSIVTASDMLLMLQEGR